MSSVGRWDGLASGLAVTTIAAGWPAAIVSVITRPEVIGHFDACDITVRHFAIAGVLLVLAR